MCETSTTGVRRETEIESDGPCCNICDVWVRAWEKTYACVLGQAKRRKRDFGVASCPLTTLPMMTISLQVPLLHWEPPFQVWPRTKPYDVLVHVRLSRPARRCRLLARAAPCHRRRLHRDQHRCDGGRRGVASVSCCRRQYSSDGVSTPPSVYCLLSLYVAATSEWLFLCLSTRDNHYYWLDINTLQQTCNCSETYTPHTAVPTYPNSQTHVSSDFRALIILHQVPLQQLVGFDRVRLEPNAHTVISFSLDFDATLSLTSHNGSRVVYPGTHNLIFSTGVPGVTDVVQSITV